MNEMTTRLASQSSASQHSALTLELAKILALVAPVTMSADQQTMWLASAVDTLKDIWANEVAEVSHAVRRNITRHSQIVPEISRLVGEQRAHKARMARLDAEAAPQTALPAADYCSPEEAKKILAEFGFRSISNRK